jgi:hypothetical protein
LCDCSAPHVHFENAPFHRCTEKRETLLLVVEKMKIGRESQDNGKSLGVVEEKMKTDKKT